MTTKFDVQAFKQRQAQNQGEYVSTNGNHIQEIETGDLFVQKEIKKDGLYIWYREFYKTGALKREGRVAKLGGGNVFVGEWKSFNKKGKLVKTENYEKGYKISYEQVLEICKKRGADLTHHLSLLTRSGLGKPPEWGVSWASGEVVRDDELGTVSVIKHISINGVTGAIAELPDGRHLDN